MSKLDWCPGPGEIHTFAHRMAGPHVGFGGQTRTEAAGQTGAQCLPHGICLLERSAVFRHAPEMR